MKQGWQGAGGLPEMAGEAAFALDLFGAEGGSTKAPNGAGGLPEMAGGTAFALELFGQGNAAMQGAGVQQNGHGAGGNVAAIGAEQDGTNGLAETAGERLPSGTAANAPLQTGATGGEISQDAGNSAVPAEDAAANGLPGADAAEDELAQAGIQAGELAQADAEAGEANGADVPNGQAGEASRDGAEAGEAEALLREMRAQYDLPEAGAAELLAAFGKDRSRGQHIREQAVRQAAFRGVMGEYLSMLREADGLRARYAGFSLPELLEDARFLGMLRAGLSMEDAYLAMHGREVLRQAIAATHRWTERQLRAAWAAESRRPAEGAMTGGSTALSRTNPAQMTRAQREAIARRVLKGERVLL